MFIDHNPVARLLNKISSSPLCSGVPFANKFPVLSPTHEYLPNLQNRAQILPKPFPVTPSRRDISGLYKELSQIIPEKRSRIFILQGWHFIIVSSSCFFLGGESYTLVCYQLRDADLSKQKRKAWQVSLSLTSFPLLKRHIAWGCSHSPDPGMERPKVHTT